MKLCTYLHQGRTAIGRIDGDVVVDLHASDPQLPSDMRALLDAGPRSMDRARELDARRAVTVPLADVQLLAPVPEPRKFLAIGMNYRKHIEEAVRAGIKVPSTQVWFNKQTSCINDPYGDVHLPRASDQLDYEVELCAVIGRRCRHVSAAGARDVVAGYMVCNDFTLRDWQIRSPTMTIGKSFNTTGPIGPWLVTADELADPHSLEMKLWVNGELRQQASTGDMVHDLWAQIEHLSTAFTLETGDLIATGTPSGVGIAMSPPSFLKVGDVVRAEISSIGAIENRVVAEPAQLERLPPAQ